jgi:hypothetical protein
MHSGWLQRWFQKKHARYRGKYVLRTEQASAPNNYIYENLAFPKPKRHLRIFASNAVVTTMLLVALAGVCALKAYQKEIGVCCQH